MNRSKTILLFACLLCSATPAIGMAGTVPLSLDYSGLAHAAAQVTSDDPPGYDFNSQTDTEIPLGAGAGAFAGHCAASAYAGVTVSGVQIMSFLDDWGDEDPWGGGYGSAWSDTHIEGVLHVGDSDDHPVGSPLSLLVSMEASFTCGSLTFQVNRSDPPQTLVSFTSPASVSDWMQVYAGEDLSVNLDHYLNSWSWRGISEIRISLPEPSTVVLVPAGLLGMLVSSRRRSLVRP
jgi:hypothetical protein